MDLSFFNHCPAANQWQKIGIKHHHGIVIPLFSLHSEKSCGIGEFPDLIPMLNWCKKIGFDTVQLLPLNDTGLDTSPYNSLSAFALNPIHLGLTSLPYLEEVHLETELKAIPRFTHANRISYVTVRESKEQFLRLYYQKVKKQIHSSENYHQFVKNNAFWLPGYALFKTLKQKHQWASWDTWEEELRHPSSGFVLELLHHHHDEVEWHYFLQYLCHQQLSHAHDYATQHQLFLMGDIPILISYDSADVWLHRSLFNLDYAAGAPPDVFNDEGQYWGFPLYNWDKMAEYNYKWWVNRLKLAQQYYHLYRIDHIVGFFRIWAITRSRLAKEGHFIPSDSTLWVNQGQRLMLMMLQASEMLPIGEDLGIVPTEVRNCLHALGICGTKVMRWERQWQIDDQYIPLMNYPIDSLTTVSTHDSETLQLWWQNNPEDAKLYAAFKGWSYVPILSRNHHKEILWDSHHSASLFHINLLQEYLALIPGFTWPHLDDERINLPGVFSDRNWSYRFKPSIEEIVSNASLQHTMQDMVQ